LSGTVDSHFENILFCGDRAVTRLIPSAETGGLTTETLSDKIAQNYLNIKDEITTTLVDNKNGRYYIFYTSANGKSYGYTFTMYKGKLKGVGSFRFLHKMVCSTQGVLSDGTDMILVGDSDGYIHQMESGTTFDGTAIPCRLTTSFYHYGSPRSWKFFERLVMEIYCPTNTEFNVAPVFDYGESLMGQHQSEDKEVSAVSANWGENINWGTFIWGSSQLGKAILYIHGHGQNMGITMRTTSKYGAQHIIHNVTADFQQGTLRQ
jgi:hypothetical protein